MPRVKNTGRKKYNQSEINLPKEEVVFENKPKPSLWLLCLYFFIGCSIGLVILAVILLLKFDNDYTNRIYPGVKISGVDVGGQTKSYVEKYFLDKNKQFKNLTITFSHNDAIATSSSRELEVGYNAKLLADQAYLLGRSGDIFSDLYLKTTSWKTSVNLSVSLSANDTKLDKVLHNLETSLNYPAQDALFSFQNNRVTAFRESKNGRQIDKNVIKNIFYQRLNSLISKNSFSNQLIIPVTTIVLKPKITTEEANKYGIKELIGIGTSTFYHSIPNRVFNVSLAASRINGTLVVPNETFSFNKALGDVSSFTGYRQAYIIKNGRTILGDGGGVCQVSTTLFRAALNAGLPITERWAHAYRVGYYEQDSPAGIDATVYDPTNDLKIKNDTGHYILIQAVTDLDNLGLTFYLYGQKDGRVVTLTKPIIWGFTPAPPDLYQDDPNLPKGVVNQIDFAAGGAKASFDYKVEKAGQIIFQKTFFSNYQPWQAIYMRGTKE